MGNECSTSSDKYSEQGNFPLGLNSTQSINSTDARLLYAQLQSTPHPLATEHLYPVQKAQILDAVRKSNIFRLERFLSDGGQPTENLLDTGANYTLIHAAAEANAFQSMELLLLWTRRNINEHFNDIINMTDHNGFTPGMLSIVYDAPETLHVLLCNGGIDFEQKDPRERGLVALCKEFSWRCLIVFEYHTNPERLREMSALYYSKLTRQSFSGSPTSPHKFTFSAMPRTAEAYAADVARRVNSVNIVKNLDEYYKLQKDQNEKSQDFYHALKGTMILTKVAKENKPAGTKIELTYIDNEFPHIISSITKDTRHKYYVEFVHASWKRPTAIFNCDWEDLSVFKNVEFGDLEQGKYEDSCLLACLVALAEFPLRLQSNFRIPQLNKEGKYTLRLCVRGIPTEVSIDDYIPCRKEDGKLVPLFSSSKSKEIWMMLIEKAFAKLYGSYTAYERNSIEETFEYLTGKPAMQHVCDNMPEDTLWELIFTADKANSIMCATTKSSFEEIDIELRQYYTVISAYEIGQHKILKLRSPWGKSTWTGDFSDKSSLWTEGMKKKIGYVNSEDGTICMTIKDFKKYFQILGIGVYNEGWYSSYASADVQPRHAEYFQFRVEEKGEVYLRVHLEDRKIINQGQDLMYPSVNFEIARQEQDGTYTLVGKILF